MKSIFSVILFVSLPYTICGRTSEYFTSDVERLNEMAKQGTPIKGELKLEEGGFLGECYVGFMYQGTKDDRPVTIKFVPNTKITESEREFELFKYLDAYNNPKVERFGIPSIYFHDQWQNYTVTAFTRLEQTLWQLGDEGYFSYESFDIMLLFKQFVVQSKYMHSHGVRHDHISEYNVIVHNDQSYLIDFDFGAKLTDDKVSCFNDNIGKKTPGTKPMFAMDDWTNFLRAMLKTIGVYAEFPHSSCCGAIRIDENAMEYVPVRNIVKRFAEEISSAGCSKVFPDYDAVYEYIGAEIRKEKGDDLAVYSWMMGDTKANAIKAIQKNPLNIKREIAQPKLIDFKTFVYKK